MIVGLVKTLFYIIIFYYLFKLIGRIVLPLIVKKGFERMQQQQHNAASAFRDQARQQEGKVTVHKSSDQRKGRNMDDNEGEYVDYEEVR